MTKINSAARSAARSKKDKVFFFGDYQGTRTTQGLDTGLVTVPSLRNGRAISPTQPRHRLGVCVQRGRTPSSGRLAASKFTGLPGFFGRAVLHAGMHECHVRVSERRHPAEGLDRSSPRTCCSTFRCPMPAPPRSPATGDERLRDDKFSYRVDGNSMRFGNLSAYYFFDDYLVDQSISERTGRRNHSRF